MPFSSIIHALQVLSASHSPRNADPSPCCSPVELTTNTIQPRNGLEPQGKAGLPASGTCPDPHPCKCENKCWPSGEAVLSKAMARLGRRAHSEREVGLPVTHVAVSAGWSPPTYARPQPLVTFPWLFFWRQGQEVFMNASLLCVIVTSSTAQECTSKDRISILNLKTPNLQLSETIARCLGQKIPPDFKPWDEVKAEGSSKHHAGAGVWLQHQDAHVPHRRVWDAHLGWLPADTGPGNQRCQLKDLGPYHPWERFGFRSGSGSGTVWHSGSEAADENSLSPSYVRILHQIPFRLHIMCVRSTRVACLDSDLFVDTQILQNLS